MAPSRASQVGLGNLLPLNLMRMGPLCAGPTRHLLDPVATGIRLSPDLIASNTTDMRAFARSLSEPSGRSRPPCRMMGRTRAAGGRQLGQLAGEKILGGTLLTE